MQALLILTISLDSSVAKSCCKRVGLWRYIYAMLIGYARVSTNDQETSAQVAALKAVVASAPAGRRPQARDGAVLSCTEFCDVLDPDFGGQRGQVVASALRGRVADFATKSSFVRVPDIHVSQCQEKKQFSWRATEERAKQSIFGVSGSQSCASRQWFLPSQNQTSICCLGPGGPHRRLSLCSLPVPKQSVGASADCSAVAQSATCRTWQPAHRVIPYFLRQAAVYAATVP
jgi:hypothetical protein